jgi:hypothetical protein
VGLCGWRSYRGAGRKEERGWNALRADAAGRNAARGSPRLGTRARGAAHGSVLRRVRISSILSGAARVGAAMHRRPPRPLLGLGPLLLLLPPLRCHCRRSWRGEPAAYRGKRSARRLAYDLVSQLSYIPEALATIGRCWATDRCSRRPVGRCPGSSPLDIMAEIPLL